MSQLRKPLPVKLVLSVLFKEDAFYERAKKELVKLYGKIDHESEKQDFDFSPYYFDEMGKPLYRRFISFKKLYPRHFLVKHKIQMVNLEKYLVKKMGKEQKGRVVNLDPGHLTAEKFVLATGKNYTHRIFLGKGVFADLTLVFQGKSFEGLPWTYKDYLTPFALEFLHKVRVDYLAQTK